MLDVPEFIPNISPAAVTVAAPTTLLVHVPPGVLLSVREAPVHTVDAPVITGSRYTVTVVVCVQPAVFVNEIVVVPAPVPVIKPVAAPADAIDVLPELHVPLPLLASVVDDPWQNSSVPVIVAGIVFTVTVPTAIHPAVGV